MKWRFLRLDWSYAAGELVIVTAGVLIALAINQWNNDRLDRNEEIVVLERLVSDLQQGLKAYEFSLGVLPGKEESLRRVYAVVGPAGSKPDDPAAFLQDVVGSAILGWQQAEPPRSTFDELLSSGRFGLIRDADLREKILEYYDLDRGAFDRIDRRQTQYAGLSYQLVPRASEFQPDTSLSKAQLQQLVASVLASPLRDYVIAELNLAEFIRDQVTVQQQQCEQLIEDVNAYLDTIR